VWIRRALILILTWGYIAVGINRAELWEEFGPEGLR
jgi:hypothetical protein